MKPYATLPVSLILICFSNLLFGQEIPDSLLLKPVQKHSFTIPDINNFIINLNETLIVPGIVNNWEKNILPDKKWTQFILKDELKKLPDGRLFLINTNTNQALHYFTTSDPISLQFDFHLKPPSHWEKLDIYLFGSGLLVYKYALNGSIYSDTPSKEFLIGTGIGFEYKVAKDVYLFHESKVLLKNQKYESIFHNNGFRYRF